MKHLLGAIAFAIAFWVGADEYEVTPDKRLYRLLNWLYDGELKPFSEN